VGGGLRHTASTVSQDPAAVVTGTLERVEGLFDDDDTRWGRDERHPMHDNGWPAMAGWWLLLPLSMGLLGVLALAGVVAAVVLFNGRSVTPVASAAVPAVALAGPSVVAAPPAQTLPAPATEPVAALPAPAEKGAVATPVAADRPAGAGCTPKVAWPSGRQAVSQPLSELTQRLLGERLARLDDACTELRQGQTWLTWGAVPAGYAMDQRLATAQIQIALSHYGSLLPQAVDGVWGAKSQRALQQFQTGVGLEPTGHVDALSGLILERFYVQER
jgi:general secretion pathway protein A